MKILFVINGLGAGGAERSLSEMLPLFQKSGIESTIVCLNKRDEGVEAGTRALGFDVRSMRSRGWTAMVRELRGLIDELRPDLVHTTIFDADVVGRVAARTSKTPVLTSLVNTTYDPVRLLDPNIRRWRLRSVKALDGWTARHLTSHFHAITTAVKDAAVRDLRIDPVTVTVVERGRDPQRLGVPSDERRAAARRDLGLDPGAPLLVTAGRQEFQKGQWHLIEAMPHIAETCPGVTLLLAGRSGNASARIEEVARSADLDGRVRFLGHREDIPEILAAADLFVFPSLYEGLGGALIEAMALGLPIVASNLPAVREVVEPDRNALLVPPASAAELSAAVGSLMVDEPRRRIMGARSRQIFEERFTLEASADRMQGLFRTVASAGRQR